MNEKHQQTARWVVGAVVIIGYFAVLLFMLYKDKTGVEILIGGLAAAFGMIVSYGFGTTSNSERKTELLAQAPPIVAPKEPS